MVSEFMTISRVQVEIKQTLLELAKQLRITKAKTAKDIVRYEVIV